MENTQVEQKWRYIQLQPKFSFKSVEPFKDISFAPPGNT
jgi:hypothetical protein